MPDERRTVSRRPRRRAVHGVPEDVASIKKAISAFMARKDPQGRRIGLAKGVYAFFDYDAEPIYVGQSAEGLRARVGRHMTNQRTDAVAMSVLDPFEVAYIEVWPIYFGKGNKAVLGRYEFAVFQKVLSESAFGAVLNEKDIARTDIAQLPESYRGCIIPDGIYTQRKHPDVRIARRAATIARLAHIISERDVSPGLRRTLVTQAERLRRLASERFDQFSNVPIPLERPGEETGENAG